VSIPKKVPQKARRAFERLNPNHSLLSTILGWLAKAKLPKQCQCGECIPLPLAFLSQRYWEGDPAPIAAHKNDLVCLNCAEPAELPLRLLRGYWPADRFIQEQ